MHARSISSRAKWWLGTSGEDKKLLRNNREQTKTSARRNEWKQPTLHRCRLSEPQPRTVWSPNPEQYIVQLRIVYIRASKNDREKMLLLPAEIGSADCLATGTDCLRPKERDTEREERNRAATRARARGSGASHQGENTDARLWDLSEPWTRETGNETNRGALENEQKKRPPRNATKTNQKP
jgi:hypothetical protein